MDIKHIGQRMIEFGFLNEEELNICLKIQSERGGLLGVIAVENSFLTEEELVKVLTER